MAEAVGTSSQPAELPALPYMPGEASLYQSRQSLAQSQQSTNRSRRSLLPEEIEVDQGRRLVIGLDFGTTYTGVAYATPADNVAILSEIDVVDDWGTQMGNSKKIPSVISYTPSSRDDHGNFYQQWGSSLSDNAVTMVNTKLQLDIESVSEELNILRSTLQGMDNLGFKYIENANGRPDFPWKGPEAIATDYLKRVFKYLVRTVNHFSPEVKNGFPVDIVATIPTSWGYPAINSTYRALTKAGFGQAEFHELRDVILVKEPEAAAVYTARYLKEAEGQEFLRLGDCFVLCDAGGGTVDLVSYRVKKVNPLELELIGFPAGHKSGSIYIDLAFKRWLKELLGEANYLKLDPENAGEIRSHAAEGKAMRELMKTFNRRKKNFKNNSEDIIIGLPSPLDTLDWGTAVRAGGITIKETVMKGFFDPRVNKIVELIDGQIDFIEKEMMTDVKDVFLVGGFGESEYLKEEIRFSMEQVRDVNVRVPDTAWTAIVQGAVVVGIEKTDNTNFMKVRSCPRNYGLRLAQEYSMVHNDKKDLHFDPVTNLPLAVNQMRWLFQKGDAILSNRIRKEEQMFIVRVTEPGSRSGKIPIYTYSGIDLPTRLKNDNELQIIHELRYNLENVSVQEFECQQESKKKPADYYAPLRVELILQKKASNDNENVLNMALYWKTRKLSVGEIDV